MKKIVSLLLMGIVLLGVTGCGKEKEVMPSNDSENVFAFKYEDMDIELGGEFSREKYGEELQYSEVPTCAFEDMDRTYAYDHYEINTYTKDGKERILSIYFLDDLIETSEGLALGDDFNKLVDTYGKKYRKQDNLYVYEKGKTNLEFIVENDVVTSIEYSYDA